MAGRASAAAAAPSAAGARASHASTVASSAYAMTRAPTGGTRGRRTGTARRQPGRPSGIRHHARCRSPSTTQARAHSPVSRARAWRVGATKSTAEYPRGPPRRSTPGRGPASTASPRGGAAARPARSAALSRACAVALFRSQRRATSERVNRSSGWAASSSSTATDRSAPGAGRATGQPAPARAATPGRTTRWLPGRVPLSARSSSSVRLVSAWRPQGPFACLVACPPLTLLCAAGRDTGRRWPTTARPWTRARGRRPTLRPGDPRSSRSRRARVAAGPTRPGTTERRGGRRSRRRDRDRHAHDRRPVRAVRRRGRGHRASGAPDRAHRQQRRAGRRHRTAEARRGVRQPAGERPPRPAAERRQLAGPVPRSRPSCSTRSSPVR